MSAERLRQAAIEIRHTAVATAYQGRTHADIERALPGLRTEDARHISLWSPPVALAVADWLDTMARLQAAGDSGGPVIVNHARALADLVLDGAS